MAMEDGSAAFRVTLEGDDNVFTPDVADRSREKPGFWRSARGLRCTRVSFLRATDEIGRSFGVVVLRGNTWPIKTIVLPKLNLCLPKMRKNQNKQ